MKLAIWKEVRLLQYWSYTAPQKLDRKKLTFGVFYYVTISPSRSVRCETNKPPAMRVRIEGYTKKNSKRDTIKLFKPIVKRKEKNMAQKAHSLSHTKWMCKYHIVFTPKYR